METYKPVFPPQGKRSVASLLGSGINGNSQKETIINFISSEVASLLGSGINGNTVML